MFTMGRFNEAQSQQISGMKTEFSLNDTRTHAHSRYKWMYILYIFNKKYIKQMRRYSIFY